VRRKLIFLNFALLALLSLAGWQLRQRWLAARTREDKVLRHATVEKPAVVPPPKLTPAQPVAPAGYVEVAQKLLFSQDRNPNVIMDPPVIKEKPKMPPLPAYFGQMAFGDSPTILLSEKQGEQKGYHAGDAVGSFKLMAFDREKAIFEWEGELVERPLNELRPKETAPQPNSSAVITAAPQTQAAAVKPLASSPDPKIGETMGGGFFGCVAGDTSPAGTVIGDYRKVVGRGLMGESCHWELIKK
jgi:hypothetical protein